MMLSDHLNIECSIRFATDALPNVMNSDKIECDPIEYEGSQGLVCPFCDYKPEYPSHLVLHIRMHTGEKPYVCSKLCGFRTAYPNSYAGHLKICNGPFIVMHCPNEQCSASTPFQTQCGMQQASPKNECTVQMLEMFRFLR
ncbi:Myoneurin [Folsomia candida]|uniref:Myoneurin n=1 Tax=Folsomia candida TaxID=158441 RepID=A0A226F4V1_FOLCA|nr:Myoneurin [Folsomia candida]